MIRMVLPFCAKDTSRSVPDDEAPTRTSLGSLWEWSGSGLTLPSGSLNAVCASSKVTPCLEKFEAAFSSFHSNALNWRLGDWLGFFVKGLP
jgi:hypothetical protein